jgi:hypothetical protein
MAPGVSPYDEPDPVGETSALASPRGVVVPEKARTEWSGKRGDVEDGRPDPSTSLRATVCGGIGPVLNESFRAGRSLLVGEGGAGALSASLSTTFFESELERGDSPDQPGLKALRGSAGRAESMRSGRGIRGLGPSDPESERPRPDDVVGPSTGEGFSDLEFLEL